MPRTHSLRFNNLYLQGRGYTFPCDKEGHVDTAALTDKEYRSYQFVLAQVGRTLSHPVVEIDPEVKH